MSDRSAGAWLFVGCLALYVLSTHANVTGMGYEREPYLTTKQLVEHGDVSLYGSGGDGRLKAYGRNGLAQPLMMVPFYLAARLVPSHEEWVIALFNPVVTAFVVLLLYRFALDLFGSPCRAMGLAVLAAAGTMLWPYTVIGMEPVQTALCLAAAWLAHRFRRRGAPAYLLGAGLAMALLFQAKRASPILIPPLLLYVAFVVLERRRVGRPAAPAAALALIAMLGAGIVSTIAFDAVKAAGAHRQMIGDLPTVAAGGWLPGGLYGFLFSAGKSFFLYNPPALLGVLAFPAFFRRHQAEGVLFAALMLVPYAFYSAFWWWGDETWGPRYLHSAVPFAVLPLGAIEWTRLRGGGWSIALRLSLLAGAAVQVLGVLHWYGRYHQVMVAAKLNLIENFQYSPYLSHLHVNLLLAWSALSRRALGRPVFLDYQPRYWFRAPAGFEPMAEPRHMDLQSFDGVGLWFPTTIVSTGVPAWYRIMVAVVASALLAVVVLAALRVWRVCRRCESADGATAIAHGEPGRAGHAS